ncbi:MAG: hypothetical protein Q9221_007540 [Calogaya cf. arnoldii]
MPLNSNTTRDTSQNTSHPAITTITTTNTSEIAVTAVFGVFAIFLAIATLWQARRHWQFLRQLVDRPLTQNQLQHDGMLLDILDQSSANACYPEATVNGDVELGHVSSASSTTVMEDPYVSTR